MNSLTSKLRVVLANPVKIFMQEYDSFRIVGFFFKDRGEIKIVMERKLRKCFRNE